jgi:hypothetical protein
VNVIPAKAGIQGFEERRRCGASQADQFVVFLFGTPFVIVLAWPARSGTLVVALALPLPDEDVVPFEPLAAVLALPAVDDVVVALVVLALGAPPVMVLASPARCGVFVVSAAFWAKAAPDTAKAAITAIWAMVWVMGSPMVLYAQAAQPQ